MEHSYKEVMWLHGLCLGIRFQCGEVKTECDSQSAIYLVKKLMYHAYINYIDIQYQLVWEMVEGGIVML